MRPVLLPLLAAFAGFALARWNTFPAKPIRPEPITATTPSLREIPATPPPSPPAAQALKPIGERLSATFHPKSPLESAARALAVIDAMTAEDFQHLGDHPGSVPTPSTHGFDQEYNRAFMDAFVERWLVVDPAGAVAGIRELEKKMVMPGSQWAGAGEFLSALARTHSEMVLGSLPEKAVWDPFDHSLFTAFAELAKREPAAARSYLERFADPQQRKSAEIAIAQGVAENDPVAAVALARTLDSQAVFDAALAAAKGRGAGAVRDVLMANAKKFPVGNALPELALRDPDEDWEALAGDVPDETRGVLVQTVTEAGRLTPEELARRIAGLDRFPPNLRNLMGGMLVGAWAEEDPRAASEWALAHAKADDSEAPESQRVNAAFYQWLRADEAAALDWCTHLPGSPLRDNISNGAAASLARAGKIDEALAILGPHPGAKSSDAIAAIAESRAEGDPAAAAAWIDSLPPEIETTGAVNEIVEKWAARDLASAAKWVESQPVGARRDAALQAYTRTAAELDPAAAGEWAATIADPKARAKAAEFVFGKMNRRDPAAARAWLRALPGVDPVWRERFVRLNR